MDAMTGTDMAVVNRVRTSPLSVHFYKIRYPWLAETELLASVSHRIEHIYGKEDLDNFPPFTVSQVVLQPVRVPDSGTVDKYLQFRATGGTPGCTYHVVFLITTTTFQSQEDCMEFQIVEACA